MALSEPSHDLKRCVQRVAFEGWETLLSMHFQFNLKLTAMPLPPLCHENRKCNELTDSLFPPLYEVERGNKKV